MSFNILDSNDKKVGDFISLEHSTEQSAGYYESRAFIMLKIANKLYTLPIYEDRLGEETTSFTLLYETTDGTGQAYIPYADITSNKRSLFEIWVLTEIGWILLNSPYVTPVNIHYQSYRTTDNMGSYDTADNTALLIPVVFGPDFRAGFTPPFRFE